MGIFSKIRELRPGRSIFDLSYSKLFTCDMGQLIPIMCDEAVPGDLFEIGNEMVVRFQPLVAPILHEVNVYVHYFFVPYRLLWSSWENFITGGINGADASVLPVWSPTDTAEGSLWDYLGFPTGVNPLGAQPISFPRDAYNLIFNQYYKDETLDTDVVLTSEVVQRRRWKKDYFASALPWQQRGTAPALPITGSSSAVFSGVGNNTYDVFPYVSTVAQGTISANKPNAANPYAVNLEGQSSNTYSGATLKALSSGSGVQWQLNGHNTVDLSSATTFTVSDLRLAFQVQKWMERNARCGARYTEYLRAHFGIAPRDERLQRAEYIGGSKSPIIVSEVLKTSTTDATSPQGNMAGHALTATRNYVSRYHVQEFGLIMGVMSVTPKAMYQQGINRQWLRKTKYDFYSPEFAHLSEQAILTAEIYASGVSAENNAIWGYQGRYDEMRYKPNLVAGQMRSTFNYWHLGRIFSSSPLLNSSFLVCDPSKRIFAAPSVPGLIVSFGNSIKALRPMPIEPDPGLIDHS